MRIGTRDGDGHKGWGWDTDRLGIYWDHEISIIVTSILTVLAVFRRKLSLNSLLIMEIMVIHSWKSQYISVWFLVMICCVIC
jgi:hypothetical protein